MILKIVFKLIICLAVFVSALSAHANLTFANSYEDDLIVFIPGITGTELFYHEEAEDDLVWLDPLDLGYLDYKNELFAG